MGLFGNKKKEAFRRGMEKGAEPFEAKFDQLHNEFGDIKSQFEQQYTENSELFQQVIQTLKDDELQEKFGISPIDMVRSMDESDKKYALGILYAVAGLFPETSEYQKRYLLEIQQYFEIAEPQLSVKIPTLEELEDLGTQKILFQLVSEYVYLYRADFLEDVLDDDVYGYFSLTRNAMKKIREEVLAYVHVVGEAGLIEKYNIPDSSDDGDGETGDRVRDYFENFSRAAIQSTLQKGWDFYAINDLGYEEQLDDTYEEYDFLISVPKEDALAIAIFDSGEEYDEYALEVSIAKEKKYMVFGPKDVFIYSIPSTIETVAYDDIDSVYGTYIYLLDGSEMFIGFETPILDEMMDYVDPSFQQRQSERRLEEGNNQGWKWSPENPEIQAIFDQYGDIDSLVHTFGQIPFDEQVQLYSSFSGLPEDFDDERVLLVASDNIGKMKKGIMIVDGKFYYSTKNYGGNTHIFDLSDMTVEVSSGFLGNLIINGETIFGAPLSGSSTQNKMKILLDALIRYAKK